MLRILFKKYTYLIYELYSSYLYLFKNKTDSQVELKASASVSYCCCLVNLVIT